MAPSSTVIPPPKQNRLLAALPEKLLLELEPRLELTCFKPGDVLHAPGNALHHAVFPVSATLSLFSILEDGASVEFASVGLEGMAGIWLFLGGTSPPFRLTVCSGGHGYRIKASDLHAELQQNSLLFHLLLGYSGALLTQVAQIAACNRHHSIDHQLCRWLLIAHDRIPNMELLVTHESLAHMLGVRREGITEAAGALQRDGLISYHRGHIRIEDRRGLEARTCECYQVIRKALSPPSDQTTQINL